MTLTSKKIIEDIKYLWLDELEFTFDSIEKNLNLYDIDTWLAPAYTLDDDNSSFAEINLWIALQYERFYPKWYTSWLKFFHIWQNSDWHLKKADCFAILFWDNERKISSNNKIVIYSWFFVLEQIKKIDFTISEFIQNFFNLEKCKLHRFDVCMDLPYSVDVLMGEIFNWVNYYSKLWKDVKNNAFWQTYYFNDSRTDKNRNYLIRVYDKVLDSVIKKKLHLFPHLENNPNMRRIEIEFRSEWCKNKLRNYSISDLLNNKNNVIPLVFCNFFNKFSKIQIPHDEIVLTPYVKNKIDLSDIYWKLHHIPDNYLCRANGYLKNILEHTGYDWFIQTLIWVYFDNPNKALYVEHIDQNKEVKRYKKYITDRDPLELLHRYILYMKNNLNIPQHKINKTLKPFIQKPILKLNT